MLKPETLEFIQSCAREFNIPCVWLFGSALDDEETARDYDLAVEGVSSNQFDDFFGKLFSGLPKPVDLIDLSQGLPINVFIRRRGQIIYEQSDEQQFVTKQIILIEKSIGLLDPLFSQNTLSTPEVIGGGTIVKDIYSGIESILRCQVTERNIPFVKSDGWHKRILHSGLSSGLITEQERDLFDELRQFRHFIFYGRSLDLDEQRLRQIASRALKTVREYLDRIKTIYDQENSK